MGGQSSQASTYENKISKSSVFLPNALKQKQKSASKTHPHCSQNKCFRPEKGHAIWRLFVHLTATAAKPVHSAAPTQPPRKFSGKVNNLSCLLLSTQTNYGWKGGRERLFLQELLVKGSGLVYLMEKAIF